MAIKVTGYDPSTGMLKKAGDGEEVQLDGDVSLGNDAGDNIEVGGEFVSSLIPNADETYDLGSSSKKWRTGHFDSLACNLRHVNTAKYTEGAAEQRYVRWDAAGSNGAPGVNNKFVAPANGSLNSVVIRATSASNSTDVAFHKASNGTGDLNTTATETQTVNMTAADTSYLAQFSSSTFSAGDILGISLTPTNGFGNVNITCVWIFDWTS
jgi:hypothetical protein